MSSIKLALAQLAPPKDYALKFSKRAKNGIFRFSFTRRIFRCAETYVLDEKTFYFSV